MKESDKFMFKEERQRYKVEIVAKEIYPVCPIYEKGDRMTIVEPGIVLEETDAICLSFLADLMAYYRALSRGVDPRKMGLKMEGENALIECHDPGGKYPDYPTDGGTVVFEIRRVPMTLEDYRKYREFDMTKMEKIWNERRERYLARQKTEEKR